LPALQAEIARLNKIIGVLMDRAERSTRGQGSDFSLFQSTIMLETQVRNRTAELEAALRENQDITRALRASEAKFHGLVNQSLVGIAITEAGRFSYTNPRFDEVFGYSADEMRALGPVDLAVEADRPRVAQSVQKWLDGEYGGLQHHFCGLRRDGTPVDIEAYGSVMDIDGRRMLISLVMDVTERTRAERELQALQERLREQSTHDALTGLYNRRFLEESLLRELLAAGRHGHPVSVIMGDLDHFKAVNDRHGHLAGDAVLRVFGELLKRHARGSDVYCRYGGEEFLLVMPDMAQDKAVERAGQLCRAMAATPVLFGEVLIPVTASFGVATFPHDGRTGDALIAAADRAMYAAKAAGRNRVSCGPALPGSCSLKNSDL
jgi:diguanylate cyclase (GGDEF)-like protein/PAS domain S-box-containing protein